MTASAPPAGSDGDSSPVTATIAASVVPQMITAPPETVRVSTRTKVTVTAEAEGDGSGGGEGGSTYYATCSKARAARDTPLYRGDPGYGEHRDREDDDVACE